MLKHLASITLLAPVFVLAQLQATGADSLGAYLWKNRPFLIFAPAASSKNLVRQRASVAANRGHFQERDIVIVEIIGDRVSTSLGSKAKVSAITLRKLYGVSAGEFNAILVGKDGGEKLRSKAVVGPDRLFRLIDSMPMRQQEMRRGKK